MVFPVGGFVPSGRDNHKSATVEVLKVLQPIYMPIMSKVFGNIAKKLLLVIWLGCIIFYAQGQTADCNIDRKDLRRYVRILSSDSLEGRGIGTEGHAKAARFIAGQFGELGLVPFDTSGYFQKFTLSASYWGQVYVKTPERKLENFVNMVFQGHFPQNDEKELEVVFAGTGTEEELKQIETEGRLVLVFVENMRSLFEVRQRLSKVGAQGIIAANPDNEKQFESIRLTLRNHYLSKRIALADKTPFRPNGLDSPSFLNSILIPNSEIKNLTGFTKEQLLIKMEENRIADVPVQKVKVKFERVHETIEARNIIGVIPGKSNKTLVVMAHYDHLGRDGDIYFPGADDNASGVAALFELAEHFLQFDDLRFTMMFMATDAEEAGLLGSIFHVNQPGFDAGNIPASFNLDMISRVDDNHRNGRYLYCVGTGQSRELDRIINRADSLYNPCRFDYSFNNSNDPVGILKRSDSYPFFRKGIPSIFFFSGMHPDYHKPTDTFRKINFRTLQNRVCQIALVLELLQREGWEN